ncbi:MAG: class I SAM-dependent methyltransferase [Actinobacteria bacterium]|nr:class I SAM-dependent methyltransferase [Actinomycetota bacterium]
MNDIKQSEKYIKDFKSKIKKEIETILESNSYLDLQNKNIYNFLIKAEQNASIGTSLPSLDKLFFLKKIIYKWIIRFLFKALRPITVNQNQFNLSVLEIFRNNINARKDLELRFANDKTQFNTRLTEQEVKLKNLNDEMCYLKKNVDYLKHSLMQSDQKIDDIYDDRANNITEKTRRKDLQSVTKKFNNDLDSLYVFLEDNLRGSREEIKNRLKVYLPILKKANVGSKNSPILDIGCGRGEWLEILKEQNFNATGIDMNKIMVKICKDLKLNVIEEEGVVYLKNIKDCSIGAVTGFHIIEHYEFDFLIELFKEAFRVLSPGGLVIFETPDPNNVLVGSCNFYLDPTHNKPLPSLLVKLLLETRGFGNISIMNLHPNKVLSKIEDNNSINLKLFNDHFFGPQDYGIIGYKE